MSSLDLVMGQLCGFLGIDPQQEYTTSYHKMTPQPVRELVLNWDTLKEQSPPKWQAHWEQDMT
jgi:hypothetical protein